MAELRKAREAANAEGKATFLDQSQETFAAFFPDNASKTPRGEKSSGRETTKAERR